MSELESKRAEGHTKAFQPFGIACQNFSPFSANCTSKNQQPPNGLTGLLTAPSSSFPSAVPQITLTSTFGLGCAEGISEALSSWYEASVSLCAEGRSIHSWRPVGLSPPGRWMGISACICGRGEAVSEKERGREWEGTHDTFAGDLVCGWTSARGRGRRRRREEGQKEEGGRSVEAQRFRSRSSRGKGRLSPHSP